MINPGGRIAEAVSGNWGMAEDMQPKCPSANMLAWQQWVLTMAMLIMIVRCFSYRYYVVGNMLTQLCHLTELFMYLLKQKKKLRALVECSELAANTSPRWSAWAAGQVSVCAAGWYVFNFQILACSCWFLHSYPTPDVRLLLYHYQKMLSNCGLFQSVIDVDFFYHSLSMNNWLGLGVKVNSRQIMF